MNTRVGEGKAWRERAFYKRGEKRPTGFESMVKLTTYQRDSDKNNEVLLRVYHIGKDEREH